MLSGRFMSMPVSLGSAGIRAWVAPQDIAGQTEQLACTMGQTEHLPLVQASCLAPSARCQGAVHASTVREGRSSQAPATCCAA